MKKSEVKEHVLKALLALLKPKGYYLVKTGWDPHFVLKGDDIVLTFFFNFKSDGDVAFSMMQMSIREVEMVIREIGMPDFDPTTFEDGKKYFLDTVEDELTVAPKNLSSGIGYSVETPKDLEFITGWILGYLQNDAEEFVRTYSHLPNILANMDKLQRNGLYWNNNGGILSGTLDAYFRGLIISKLCNDPNYDEKVLIMDEVFGNPLYEEWLLFYNKLKRRLETVEPKYSYTPNKE